jgi:hypothetical protein
MKWFKFYGAEYLSDPKILTLTASERSCWITLLSYASVNDNINDNGVITFLSEQQLLIQAGIGIMEAEFEKTLGVLKKLEKLKMITLDNTEDNAKITILNWQKRQETSLTGYERVKRYREKHKPDNKPDNANDNAKITSDKNRIDKIRIDKNIKEKKTTTAVAVIGHKTHEDITFVYDIFKNHYGVSPKSIKAKDGRFDLNAAAAKRLVKVHGRENLETMLKFTLKYQYTDKFCRISTNPLEFEKNYTWYKTYFEQKKVELNKRRVEKLT